MSPGDYAPFAAVQYVPKALLLLARERGTEELPPAVPQPSEPSMTCTRILSRTPAKYGTVHRAPAPVCCHSTAVWINSLSRVVGRTVPAASARPSCRATSRPAVLHVAAPAPCGWRRTEPGCRRPQSPAAIGAAMSIASHGHCATIDVRVAVLCVYVEHHHVRMLCSCWHQALNRRSGCVQLLHMPHAQKQSSSGAAAPARGLMLATLLCC